ncbi:MULTISPECIES: RDD family protein [unclassified Curtobacterium]|uniref:RDD family protein n=1 Tax=unclassified Curtobacterium TaxID=257496 RepID=UPI000DA8F362|nr:MULTISPECIES: RDD family protein [unclassified Curtobacterium]PZE29838.1 RDD family protein [Curtobacterium sp. MCBD17_028]PZE75758.1 RDD family protein [Curtobacterium sp. MCBD17_019]PZF60881.1 RDD family protein [Curtobacterium sp. MCBD17_034]PZM40230.1 RDD family protein [Curtobacterium sp. MCBD17_031]
MPGPTNSAPAASSDTWPGKDLGLPAEGSRSVARLGRRIAALAIDGVLADLVAVALHVYPSGRDVAEGWWVLGIFAVLQIVFIAVLSGSFGHLCVGLRVVPVRPGYIGVVRPVVRTVLLCIVIPAFIFDRDQRGLHDRIPGTVLVRR